MCGDIIQKIIGLHSAFAVFYQYVIDSMTQESLKNFFNIPNQQSRDDEAQDTGLDYLEENALRYMWFSQHPRRLLGQHIRGHDFMQMASQGILLIIMQHIINRFTIL